MHSIIASCDLVVTPVVDPDPASWQTPGEKGEMVSDWFVEYAAPAWYEYLTRAWCRVEMMIASNRPVLDVSRASLFRGGLQSAIAAKRRPHVLFGHKELTMSKPPIFLPAMLHSTFDEYAPEKGSLTNESDRTVVDQLSNEVRAEMVVLTTGFDKSGKYPYSGGPGAGFGKLTWPNGRWCEADWYDEKRGKAPGVRGKGKTLWPDGQLYEGEYLDDAADGQGTMTYPGGGMYVGGFKAGRYDGHGKISYPVGDTYEGELQAGQKHGVGTYVWKAGNASVSRYEHNKDVGEGAKWGADRQPPAYRITAGLVGDEITLEEAAAIAAKLGLPVPPPIQYDADPRVVNALQEFKGMDTDGNGTIEKAEFKALMMKLSGLDKLPEMGMAIPLHALAQIDAHVEMAFAVLDANNNGVIDVYEYTEAKLAGKLG